MKANALLLLLLAAVIVPAQSPPTTYSAETEGYVSVFNPPTAADGTSGAWSFHMDGLSTYNFWSYLDLGECRPSCTPTQYWAYDYSHAGTFTLGDGADLFTGYINDGYGAGVLQEYGPQIGTLDLDVYVEGEWNDGLKQAGLLVLHETWEEGLPHGMATLTFGPAPEPASFLLFGSGLAGVLGVVRRRMGRS